MSSFSTEDSLTSKTLQRLVGDPTCVCERNLATVQYINQTSDQFAAATIPGLSHHETALLAGILTGLATFLFLALPILCCLCPIPCACCGGGGAGGAKGGKGAGARGGRKFVDETESVRSSFSEFSSGKYGRGGKASLWEPAGGGGVLVPDMKIPRVWTDSLSKSLDDYDSRWRQGGEADWEGMDVARLEQEAMYEGRGGGNGGGSGGIGGGELAHQSSSRMAQEVSSGGGNNEGVVEYETTRHITIETIGVPEVTRQRTFEAMASGLPQQEYIYETTMRQQHLDGGVERIRLT